jgi:hypothetical protein
MCLECSVNRKNYRRVNYYFLDNEEETPYADPRKRIGTCSQSIQQVWALLLKRFHHYNFKNPTKRVGLVQRGLHHHLIEN